MKIRTLALAPLPAPGLGRDGGARFRLCRLQPHGDCWHTTDRYDYRPAFGIRVHDDNWKWRARDALSLARA